MLPLGARYMLLASLAFSVMTLFVKLVGQRLPTQEIVAVRAALTLVFSYVALRRAGVPLLGSRRPLLWVRGVFGFLALSSVYYAVARLPLAEATVIQYLHPPLTALLAALVLREPLERAVLVSMALGLLGLVLIAQPRALFGLGTAPLEPLAIAAAVAGAILSACAYVTVRKLGASEHPLVIVLYFPLVALPAAIPTMLSSAIWPEGIEWLWLLLLGIATQIGQVMITRALALDPAGQATAYSYVQVPLAALWGGLFFDAWPNRYSLLGALLILGGALLNVRASRRRQASAAAAARV